MRSVSIAAFLRALLLVCCCLLVMTWGDSTDLRVMALPETTSIPDLEDPVTRLIAMGDTGTGSDTPYRVAAGAQVRCDRAGGCDGFLMLGNTINHDGPDSATDSQFDRKIDQPYVGLKQGPPVPLGLDLRPRLPIYATLGNHDLGGAGLNTWQIPYFLEYAKRHDWFVYPAEIYDRQLGQVHLISIHTNPMAYLGTSLEIQGDFVDQVVQATDAAWIVVMGHHPYRSNGIHGNAGSYEGIPGDLGILGGRFREWVETHLCNQVDFYLSGHDQNRQWLRSTPMIPSWPPNLPDADQQPCQTQFAVSGAGARSQDMIDRGNDLAFASDQLGFLFMEFYPDRAHVEFCNAEGTPEWSQDFRHQGQTILEVS